MTSEANRSPKIQDVTLQIEQELLAALLCIQGESRPGHKDDTAATLTVEGQELPVNTVSYPWNPAQLESEGFFTGLEQELALDAALDATIASHAAAIYDQIDQICLQTSLSKRFVQLPKELLAAITQNAQQVLSSSTALADQLVQCVQGILPNWAAEDLYIFARPLAYATRNRAADPLTALEGKAWEQLSEVEKAKLVMAAARDALNELNEA